MALRGASCGTVESQLVLLLRPRVYKVALLLGTLRVTQLILDCFWCEEAQKWRMHGLVEGEEEEQEETKRTKGGKE